MRARTASLEDIPFSFILIFKGINKNEEFRGGPLHASKVCVNIKLSFDDSSEMV